MALLKTFSQPTFILLCYVACLSLALHIQAQDPDAVLADCYDYIVVGGGVSGLVVANRLTEDPHITVLVLEAGDFDNHEDFILNPLRNREGLGSKYDWNLWTTPQTHLDGVRRPYDLGRGVGGGSLINGMCWTRGSKSDYDAWVDLGNPGWGWDDLLPYFKKIENYTNNADGEHQQDLQIQPNPSTHGSDGYIHVSYPRYFYEQSKLFLDGLRELGIPTLNDPSNGTTTGAMLIPNSLSPDNQTRSNARQGYLDTVVETRQNLHVATGQHVIRLLTNQTHTRPPRDDPAGLWVNGVEFVSDGNLLIRKVACKREVILAAGNIHTPQILELSGIGQADILKKFDIPLLVNLPGVGNNFQDHPYIGVVYYYNNASYFNINKQYSDPELYSEFAAQYYMNKTGPWTSGAINTVAFPSLQSISRNWTNMVADAASQATTQHLLPTLDATVIAGYESQKRILVDFLSRSNVSAYEVLNNNFGLMSIATMHPFSRGSVHIQSTNPFIQPLIAPRYCSNPMDCQVLVEGLLFNNRIVNTTAIRILDPAPYPPFLQGATPETLIPAIRHGLRTGSAGTGSTSMMPLEKGGVVDTHLRVYGTRNLRIVDAGILPLVPASHMQAPVYAVAEKAADVIRKDNAGILTNSCGTIPLFNISRPSNMTEAAANGRAGPSAPVHSFIVAASTNSTLLGFPETVGVGTFINTPDTARPLVPSTSPALLNVAAIQSDVALINLSSNASTPSSISAFVSTRPSTFAQLLNLSEWQMSNSTRKPSPTLSRLAFADGVAPMVMVSSVKTDAIFLAASLLLEQGSESTEPPTSTTSGATLKSLAIVELSTQVMSRFRLGFLSPTTFATVAGSISTSSKASFREDTKTTAQTQTDDSV